LVSNEKGGHEEKAGGSAPVVPPSFYPDNRSDVGKDTTRPEFDWPVILSRDDQDALLQGLKKLVDRWVTVL